MSEPLDPAVGELLSADLDGALAEREREAARAWVERSPEARAERAALAAVKATLRRLPPVEPPPGFFETMLDRGSPRPDATVVPFRRRERRPLAASAAAVAAAAAAWVVIGGTGAAAVTPPVDDVEAALAGSADGGIDLLRADGGRVALHEQAGDVAWGELPHGERGSRSGAATWIDLTTDPGMARIVVARDDVVLTLASDDVPADELVALAVVELRGRDGDPSLVDRFRRACEGLLGIG